MVAITCVLLKQVSGKVWHSTIKIPQLKAASPVIDSIYDEMEVLSLLKNMFEQHKGRILVITGAGISTDSGIPDYRGDQGTYVRNPNHRPILYHELASSHNYRQRYWSRSYLGWPRMANALPNDTHHVLKSLLMDGSIQSIITQNVDNLHVKAMTPTDHLLELHGTLQKVECMDCGKTDVDRNQYQNRIHARNPSWGELIGKGKINPDGDVELPTGVSYDDFDIPPCLSCGSLKMKPNVVFFGENIKKSVTKRAEAYVDEATALLVLGTSLATYSSYKLIRQAQLANKPIGIITKGPTRADNLMDWKGEVGCTPVLKSLLQLIRPDSEK